MTQQCWVTHTEDMRIRVKVEYTTTVVIPEPIASEPFSDVIRAAEGRAETRWREMLPDDYGHGDPLFTAEALYPGIGGDGEGE